MMCKGILPQFQEPLQLEITGWAGRYAEVIWVTEVVAQTVVSMRASMYGGGREIWLQVVLTTMTLPTNMVYTKKSPGCGKRGDSRSMELPYWYRKYGSSRMPNFGFVIRNAVKSRQSCGNILVVKT
jgi:hypothetical protein